MSHVRLFLLAALTGGWGLAVAQEPVVRYSDTVRVESMTRPPRWVVSLAPLAFLDPENTVQVGLERLLAGRYSVLGEIGYGPSSLSLSRPYNSSPTNGIRDTWRGRVEWRIYTRRIRSHRRWQPGRVGRTVTRKPLGNYVAFDGFYKQSNATESGSVGRACEDGSCQYFQRFQSRVVKYVGATHVKVGRQALLFNADGNSRFVLDMYLGLGLRRRLVKQYDLPEPEDGGSYFFTSGSGVFDDILFDIPVRMSATVGFRIGYVF
ncbi:hypothetical protein [Spirosoma arcticum]